MNLRIQTSLFHCQQINSTDDMTVWSIQPAHWLVACNFLAQDCSITPNFIVYTVVWYKKTTAKMIDCPWV